MFIDLIIILLVLGCLAALYLVKTQAKNPSALSIENSKSIKNMSEHLEKIDAELAEINRGMDQIAEAHNKVRVGISDYGDKITANKQEIDNLKSRSDQNDKIMVENMNKMNDKLKAIPRLVERKLSVMNRPVTVQLAPQKTIGYERIVQRDKKKYKQMIFKTQPLKEKKTDKYKMPMPGIKEARDKIVEAGL